MKKNYLLLFAISIITGAVLSACQQNDPQPTGDLVISAEIADVAASKTSWDGPEHKIKWDADDAIGVFAGANDNIKMTLGQDGKFRAKPATAPGTAAEYYGYYPYSQAATLDGLTLSTVFPEKQTYSPDGFDAAPMVAYYKGPRTGAEMTFQHVYSILKISAIMDGSAAPALFDSVTIIGNNSEILAGKAEIDMTGISNTMTLSDPVGVVITEGVSAITLDCGAGAEISSTARTNFYVTIPAGEYPNGFSIVLTAGNASSKINYNKPVNAARGSLTPIEVTVKEPREEMYNIPDPMFRKYLIDNRLIVTDDTGSIIAVNNPENLSILIRGAQYPGIKTLKGVEYFTECVYLELHYYKEDSHLSVLEELDVTKLTKLKHLQFVRHKNLKTLDLSQNAALKELWLTDSGITSLNLSNMPNLTMLTVGGNPLTELDVSKLPNVEVINIGGCADISSIDISNNPKLISFTVANTKVTSLDLSQHPGIVYLDISDTDIDQIDVSVLPDLYSFFASRTKIKRIDLSNNHKVVEVLINSIPHLEYIDLSGCNVLNNVAMTGKDGKPWSLMQASGTAFDLSLMNSDYYNLKTFIMDDMNNQVITDFICKDTTLETISLQNSIGINKIVVQDNPQLGALYVNGLDLENIDMTVTGNKTEDIIITSPRQ